MGRKLVRDNDLLQSGGLLSFPRTGCALRAPVILSRGQRSRHYGRTNPTTPRSRSLRARKLPDCRQFGNWPAAQKPAFRHPCNCLIPLADFRQILLLKNTSFWASTGGLAAILSQDRSTSQQIIARGRHVRDV
jgi:hypothetical protein